MTRRGHPLATTTAAAILAIVLYAVVLAVFVVTHLWPWLLGAGVLLLSASLVRRRRHQQRRRPRQDEKDADNYDGWARQQRRESQQVHSRRLRSVPPVDPDTEDSF